MNNFSINLKLMILGTVPFVAFLVLAFAMIQGAWKEITVLRIMDNNAAVMVKTSALIGDLQRERGRTALFLSGGVSLQDVKQFRSKTDASMQLWEKAMKDERISYQEAVKEVQYVSGELGDLRRKYSSQSLSLTQEQIAAYNSLIKKLIDLQSGAANSQTARGYGKTMSSLIILETARENAGQLRANLSSIIARNTPLSDAELERIIMLKANVSSNISSPALVLSPTIDEKLKNAQKSPSWGQVDGYFNQVIQKTATGDFGIQSDNFWDAISSQIDDIAEIITLSADEISHAIPAFVAQGVRTFILTVSGTLVLSITLVLLLVYLSRSILVPIRKCVTMLRDISQGEGDLTRRLDVSANNEIGELSAHFNNFVDKLQRIITSVINNADAVAASATELYAISIQIAATAEEMSAQSSTVASSTDQATKNVSSISSAAEQMSSSANSVATAIEEMSASLNEVSRNCSKELQIAAEANTHAMNSKDVMKKLGDAAKSIGKVVEVINDIADQTNLLALNATIEAASAGEAGKGFTVVAGEVKELAKQTAKATQEIQQQIEEMQTNTEMAVNAIESVTKVIEEVNAISQTIVSAVEEQSATVNEISRSVGEVSTSTQEVSKNVTESATGLSEVSSTIAEVNNAVADTAKGIVQVKTSAEDLSKLSEGLKKLLGQFKI